MLLVHIKYLKIDLGNVFSWGDSANGKLGFPEGNLIVSEPTEIQMLKGKNVNCIGVGELMTVISTSSFANSIVRRSSVAKNNAG